MSVISSLMVKIGADSSGLKKGLDEAKTAVEKSFDTTPVSKFSAHVEDTGKRMEGLIGRMKTFAAVAAAGFGLSALVNDAAAAGDNIYRLSQRMHISAGEAGNLSRIMSLTGGDVTSLSTAMMRLDKSFTSASTEGEKTRSILAAVGVELTNANGQLLPINEQLKGLAAGYKKATEAGYGQEFIMNTLGVRGMALVSTLEQYNDAAETAGKVKTIGLDAKGMHELNMQLKIMQMESSQIQLALVAGFAPVVNEFLPGIMSGLQSTATFLRENKTEIAAVTKAAVEFYAAMKAISLIGSAGAGILSFWNSIKVAAVQTAVVQETAEAELSAAQIKHINKVVARSQQAYTKREIDAIRAAQQEGLASDEARAKLETNLVAIQLEAEKSAASISAAFTRHFMEVNRAAAVMAAETNTAIASTGVTAAEAIAVQTTATANLTAAHMAEGTAATVAGAKNTAAKGAATKATAAQIVATGQLTAAHVAEGTAAAAAGVKSISFTGTAIKGVRTLGTAVLALTGGWIGLAAAIAYAGYCLYQYKNEQFAEEKAHTYSVDGENYIEKDGYFYRKGTGRVLNPEALNSGYVNDEEIEYDTGGQLVSDDSLNEKLQSAWWERHKDDADYKAQLEKEEADERLRNADSELAALMQNMNSAGTGSTESFGGSAEKQPVTYQVAVPIGEDVVGSALNHIGESWGENTCAIFASSMLEEAGVYGLSDPNGDNMKANAGAAYHDVNDGYQPKAGDIIEWGGHVGIYDGNGGYIASNTKTGIHQGSMAEAEDWFGPVQGYVSTAEYTGNKTVTKTMDSEAKAAEDSLQKLNKAKEDATKLFNSMEIEIGRETKTDYSYGMDQLEANIRKKQVEINQLKTAGVDTTMLESELADYGAALKSKVVEKWQEASESIKNTTAITLAETNSDYKAAAEAQYQMTLTKLSKERKDKEKAVLKDKDDAEGRLAIDKWYVAESNKAIKELTKAKNESFNRAISDFESLGDLKSIRIALDSSDADDAMFLEGQQELAKEYVELWKASHKTVQSYAATLAANVNQTMADSFKEFIQGTKSAMDLVHDFGRVVLNTIAEIVAKQAASQLVGSLFKSFKLFSDGGDVKGYASGGALAGGGIEGAGTGTSDSILAYLEQTGQFIRLSDGEFVMTAEATKKNRPMLEAMNAGAFKNGGSISAPAIRSASADSSYGSSASAPKGGVIVNITNNTNSEVTAKQSGFEQSTQRYILDIVIDGAQRNVNGFGNNLKAVMGG